MNVNVFELYSGVLFPWQKDLHLLVIDDTTTVMVRKIQNNLFSAFSNKE